MKLYPRGLRWITFGAAQVLSITGTCLERGAKRVSLLSAGKVPNRFLIQSEFRQLCVHKILLNSDSTPPNSGPLYIKFSWSDLSWEVFAERVLSMRRELIALAR